MTSEALQKDGKGTAEEDSSDNCRKHIEMGQAWCDLIVHISEN